jgi:AcrR family transcriptional regulator
LSADPVQLFGRGTKDDPVVRDILGVALREFSLYGLAGARVDAIAAQTKTSKRMIYYHFGSKEGLYDAVLAYGFSSIRRDDEAPLKIADPLQAMVAFAGDAFDVHADNPDFVHLVMQENLRNAASLRKPSSIQSTNAIGLHIVEKILVRGQATGVLRADLTALEVYANIIAMCFHFASNRASFSAVFGLDGDSDAYRQARRRSILDAVARYVKA